MAKKKRIKISLSESSINKAIDDISFRKDMLYTEVQMFLDILINEGITVANQKIQEAPTEYRSGVTVIAPSPERTGYIYGAVIRLEGSQALFVEFSAGKTFGKDTFDPLPNNPRYGSGMGMGTYNPDSDNWKKPGGWDYPGGHTLGTPAVAPLYNADKRMRDVIMDAAKRVWG